MQNVDDILREQIYINATYKAIEDFLSKVDTYDLTDKEIEDFVSVCSSLRAENDLKQIKLNKTKNQNK